jgi:hypothetical protein
MSRQHYSMHTCIALAASLAAGAVMANEVGYQDPPLVMPPSHPVAQGVSGIVTRAQALPLQLMPDRLSAVLSPPSWSRPGASASGRAEPSVVASVSPRTAAATPQAAPEAAPVLAAASPSPAPQAKGQGYWQLDVSDGSVKRALNRWSQDSGWQLVWELPVDFPVGASAAFSGEFEEAVAAVALSMQNSEMPMKAIFYRGNKVLRIVAKGAQ